MFFFLRTARPQGLKPRLADGAFPPSLPAGFARLANFGCFSASLPQPARKLRQLGGVLPCVAVARQSKSVLSPKAVPQALKPLKAC